MAIGGKHHEWAIRFQGTFNGFTEANTTSTNPQITDVLSHPLGIAKNGFATKNDPIKWGKHPVREIGFHKTFLGIVGAETTSIHTQIVGLLCPLTEQHKNRFPSLEKLGKMQKNVREAPSLLTGAKKWPPQTPKSWPLSSHSPSNTKSEFWKWRNEETTTNCEGESSTSFS